MGHGRGEVWAYCSLQIHPPVRSQGINFQCNHVGFSGLHWREKLFLVICSSSKLYHFPSNFALKSSCLWLYKIWFLTKYHSFQITSIMEFAQVSARTNFLLVLPMHGSEILTYSQRWAADPFALLKRRNCDPNCLGTWNPLPRAWHKGLNLNLIAFWRVSYRIQ